MDEEIEIELNRGSIEVNSNSGKIKIK